jgi:hypothetical protein
LIVAVGEGIKVGFLETGRPEPYRVGPVSAKPVYRAQGIALAYHNHFREYRRIQSFYSLGTSPKIVVTDNARLNSPRSRYQHGYGLGVGAGIGFDERESLRILDSGVAIRS